MRNNRLRELGKISFQAISAYSVFDLLVSYIFGYGTIWIYKWPTFWFIWLEVMHCLLAYALQLIVKSVATMPKIFSTWINILMLVSIISFFDYAMGSNIIWIENWPFPYLIAAPSQISFNMPKRCSYCTKSHCIRMPRTYDSRTNTK